MYFIKYAVVLLLIAVIFLIQRWKRRRYYYLISQIPGPKGLPLFGNALDFLKKEEIFDNMQKVTENYGSVFKLKLGNMIIIVLANPQDICTTLNHPGAVEKDPLYLSAKNLVGYGLVTAPYEAWKVHRKVLNSAFSRTIIDKFLDIFDQKTKVLLKVMEKEAGNFFFNIRHYFDKFSMHVLLETSMGYNEDTQRNDSGIFAAFQLLCDSYIQRALRFWLASDFIFFKTNMGKKQKSSTKFVRDLVKQMIQNKKSDMNNMNTNQPPKIRPFLDLILELSEHDNIFTSEEVEDEVCALLMAGIDTISIALSFVAVMIGIHQDVQKNVCAELEEIFENADRRTALEDLQKMTYLERVIKESLRLFPPAGNILRKTTLEVQLEQYTIPADTTIAIGISSMHRNPEVWSNPNKFDPDRFLPEKSVNRHTYAYLPFGGGPRNCIGHRYAMILMKTTISNVLRRYKITSDKRMDDIQLSMDVFTTIQGGFNVSIEHR